MVCFPACRLIFVGSSVEKERFLKGLQSLGLVEFERVFSCAFPFLEKYHVLVRALSLCKEKVVPLKSERDAGRIEMAVRIAKEIVASQARKEKLLERKKTLLEEREVFLPFGLFRRSVIHALAQSLGKKISFLVLTHKERHCKEGEAFRFLEVFHDATYCYGLLFGEPDADVQSRLLSFRVDPYEWKEEFDELEKAILIEEEQFSRLKKLTPFLEGARKSLLETMHLCEAEETMQERCGIFTVSVWSHPVHRKDIDRLAHSCSVYVEEVLPPEKEVAPTVFHNEGYARVGQDLVEIYDVPHAFDPDPSLWVLAAFACFFALIMADMGYGLLIFCPSLYLRGKGVVDPLVYRLIKLGLLLGATTTFWGGMMGSFFGMTFSSALSPLHYLASKKAVYHQNRQDETWAGWLQSYPRLKEHVHSGESPLTFEIVLGGQISTPIKNNLVDSSNKELVLMIGVLHLLLSMWRGRARTLTHWGWAFFLIGGYFVLADSLGATLLPHYVFSLPQKRMALFAKGLTGCGFVLAHLAAIKERGLLSGVLEWMNAIQLFSDVLSYLRLYALGLSGAIIASTFNSIAGLLPLPFALPCLLLGHVINFGLGIMGAVVHSLRLNFLEWYRYSFEGGGRKFRPLSLQE
ncbi:hypothetical protein [Candidatus Similichlamydia laticola]|uniref:V-type ATP synthase subunit I n=1 Tax=Candidatus Similichlamydia laticola TaxID=2170265 RepID=A0A369KFE0_9BACT|nr:hypothetical protein [Candidatus Similichlamydia laticola]RDB31617.1 V-type ATP synthase subunit I [Candidatus Similichlamydia laticola]